MTNSTLKRKPRLASPHWMTKQANRRRSALIRDVAAIMGEDLDLQMLSKDVKLPVADVYTILKT